MNTAKITKKQVEIIHLLVKYRYLNRIHIQKLLNHKQSHRVKVWLRDLSNKEYLVRFYSNKFGENIKPAYYCLAVKSRKILKPDPEINPNYLDQIYREKKLSQRFIDQCFFVADTYLTIRDYCIKHSCTFHFLTRSQLNGFEALPSPLPAAMIRITQKRKIARYFVEYFDSLTPRFAIRKNISQYLDDLDIEDFEKIYKISFPAIIYACPNEMWVRYVSKQIKKSLDESYNDVNFIVTTQKSLSQAADNFWVKPMIITTY